MIDKLTINNIDKVLQEAILQFNRKNVESSQNLFFIVLKKDPINPEANYYLGLMYARKNNYSKAVIHLKTVVDMGANFLYTQQCRMILGFIYFKNQEYKRAEYEFLEVLKSKVNIVQVYAALAAIEYYLGEKKEALKYAKKACDIDALNLNVKNTYGFFLCDYEIDVPKGIEMLREVIRVKPNNPSYLDSLGWAYYKKGDKKAAIASLKKALEISDNNPEIKIHFDIVNR
ncbi:MAG: tetratricopeptide repeat protein [Spirochaetes bacterium]|nr:tetratricopeptide repeat protein [Spirochaetota bacterium]